MHEQHLHRLADLIVRYSTRVRCGDLVGIHADPVGFPLITAMWNAVLDAGGYPVWVARSDRLDEILLEHPGEHQLARTPPLELHALQTEDVHVTIWGETNTRGLARVDARRAAAHAQSRAPMLHALAQREALEAAGQPGGLRWCGVQFATEAGAQDAEMSLARFRAIVHRAALLHRPDPVGAWRCQRTQQERLCERLRRAREIRFRAPPRDGHDGTDLLVDLDGASWINCAGEGNMPDGEVFAGPPSADGHVNVTLPCVYLGREVIGARLEFRSGRVVDATAARNEDHLLNVLALDAGASVLAEVALGTNYAMTEPTRNSLLDEKLGGSFHVALGAGYPRSGNTNASGVHWDMVSDLRAGGTVEVDGEVIQQDGRFVHPAWPGAHHVPP